MDVARTSLDRAVQQPVREPHDGTALGFSHQLVDGLAFVVIGNSVDDDIVLALDDALHHLAHRGVDMVVTRDRIEDLGRRRQHRLDEHAGVETQVLECRHIHGVGHRHDQCLAAFDLDRQREVLARHLLGDLGDRQFVDGHEVEVDQRHAELAMQQFHELAFRHCTLCDEHGAQHEAGALLFRDRGIELGGRDQPGLDQQLAEPLVSARHAGAPVHGGWAGARGETRRRWHTMVQDGYRPRAAKG